MRNENIETWRNEKWVNQFLFYKSALADFTIKKYEKWLKLWVEYCSERWTIFPDQIDYNTCHHIIFGDSVLETPIKKEVVKEFLNSYVRSSQETARRVLYIYFKWLIEMGIVQSNPVPKPISTVKPFRELGFTIEEIEELFDKIRKEAVQIRGPLSLQFAAGLRVSELCSLRLDDIEDISRKWSIYIRREARKGKVAWSHPLPDIGELIHDYLDYRKELDPSHDLLFVDTDGKPLKPTHVNEMLKKVWILTSLTKKPTSHDLRRAFATVHKQMLDNPDLFVRLMRHDNIYVSLSYPKEPLPSDVREALDKLEIRKIVERFVEEYLGQN